MSLNLVQTPAIKRAVQHINELDISKFPLLLTRILSKLHLKDERTFSDEEEEKLQSSLSLAAGNLQLVIQTLEFFLHQAAYHTAKPAVFGQQLQQLEIEDEKVKVIVESWKNAAADVIVKLRQRTITPKQLEDINWRLNLQMAQSTKTKMKLPNAMFEFGIKDENSESKEKILFEMTHDELYSFYTQDERTFSDEEEEKLQSSLSLAAGDLQLVIQTLEFFLHQAAYHTDKPAVFGQQLQQLEIEDEKVKVIVESWKNAAADVIVKLRQRTITPKQLEDINWRLNLQMAQSTKTKMKLPNAMFEFGIKDENSESKEKIQFEMTHDELYSFYTQLETIQKQLDNLG